jgi:hypothetical protein
MAYYFDLRFCPFWDRDGPFRDRESAVWDRCGPVGARLGPFSTGFGPVSDRLRFQLLGHEIRTAFCIVFTLVFDVGDSHEKSAFRDHPRRRARSARTTSTISATSFNASHQLSNGTPLCVSTRASPRLYQQPRRATSSRRRRYHLIHTKNQPSAIIHGGALGQPGLLPPSPPQASTHGSLQVMILCYEIISTLFPG